MKYSRDYNLIVSDFDETLGNQEKIISPKVTSAVRRWISSGRRFSLATGRQYLMITDVIEKLGLEDPIVVRGGAEIVDARNGKIIHAKSIDKKTVKEFVGFLHGKGIELALEQDDVIFSDYYRRSDYIPTITFKPLSEFNLSDIPKMLIFAIEGDIDKKISFVTNELVNKFPQLFIVPRNSTRGKAWDVTSERATKNLAVLKLITHLGLDRKETVGVGDGYNDFPLLEACGLKVAMGNANQELKEIADIIVPTYEEDGVAYLIDKLLAAEGARLAESKREPRPKGRE